VEGRREALTVVDGPPEELGERDPLGGVLRVLVDEDVAEGGDGVRVGSVGVHDRDAKVLGKRGDVPGGSGRDALDLRLDEIADLVLQVRDGELVLHRVGELHVTDGAGGGLHLAGDSLVSLAAEPHRPAHAGPLAHLVFPGGAHRGQVVREHRRGPAAVAAVDDGDGLGGERRARVEGGDLGVVPGLDLTQEDSGHHLARELQRRGHTGNVVCNHHGAEGGGDVNQLGGSPPELLVGHRGVAGAEVDGPLGDLTDAAAGADRLVVQLDGRILLRELRHPLRIEGIGKGRSGAVDGDTTARGTFVGGALLSAAEEGDREEEEEEEGAHGIRATLVPMLCDNGVTTG
jgi:hypothetical protein